MEGSKSPFRIGEKGCGEGFRAFCAFYSIEGQPKEVVRTYQQWCLVPRECLGVHISGTLKVWMSIRHGHINIYIGNNFNLLGGSCPPTTLQVVIALSHRSLIVSCGCVLLRLVLRGHQSSHS